MVFVGLAVGNENQFGARVTHFRALSGFRSQHFHAMFSASESTRNEVRAAPEPAITSDANRRTIDEMSVPRVAVQDTLSPDPSHRDRRQSLRQARRLQG